MYFMTFGSIFTSSTYPARRPHLAEVEEVAFTAALRQRLCYLDFGECVKVLICHRTRVFTHSVTGIENSLSHEAFGGRVKGGQFHCVTIRGAHLKQHPLVREKLTLLAKNTFLIDLG